MAERDDEVNQGDSVSSDMGEHGQSNLVGKNLAQRNQQQHVENNIILPDLGGRNPTLADLYNIIAYDRLTGEPGLVGKVNAMDRRLTTVESKVVAVDEKVSLVDKRLINIEHLVNRRNIENRDKVHISATKLILLMLIVFVIGSLVAPWLQSLAAGGVVDGYLGFSIFLRGASRYWAACSGWLCLVAGAADGASLCARLGIG